MPVQTGRLVICQSLNVSECRRYLSQRAITSEPLEVMMKESTRKPGESFFLSSNCPLIIAMVRGSRSKPVDKTNCTVIKTTVKTTPVSVTVKRTLSGNKFRSANEGIARSPQDNIALLLNGVFCLNIA